MKYEKEHYFLYCKKYKNKLDWWAISANSNITWEIIQNNPDKNWFWNVILVNQNITWEIIQDNPDKTWHWWAISDNQMNKSNK